MNTNVGVKVNRNVKDSLFRRIFGTDKENALSLYNALNGSNYTQLEDLQYTTLEDVVYMKMKNDLSFLICFTELNLYEQQSTYNPNMPLRGLFYFADLYRQLLPENESIYGRKLVRIPTPKYIVLYNGNERDMPGDMIKLKLSDAFEKPEMSHEFEWTATMMNVNIGHNKWLLEKCKSLKEYSIFTGRIRDHSRFMPMAEAIERAMRECIRDGVLKDLLEKNQKEVKNMCLTEFDEEKYRQICRAEAREEGLEEGLKEGRKEGLKEGRKEGLEEGLKEGRKEGLEEGLKEGIHAFVALCIEVGQTKEEVLQRLQDKFSMTLQQASVYVDQYCK